MSSRASSVVVNILANNAALRRTLQASQRDVSKFARSVSDSGRAGRVMGAGIHAGASAAKGAMLGLGAAAAGVGVVFAKFAIDGMKHLGDVQRLNAQTAAAIKSTGAAAKVSAQHVENLADKLEKMSGADADAIQKGENILLTFTGIRNEAGKSGKVFDQTTKIMLDMSTALGQDMSASAMQLGKALNDPVKGVSALQRVGVTFTQSQKDQIAAFEKNGQTAKAQGVILRELQREFGGSARAMGKTLPGQINILKARLGDLQDELAAKLLPVVTRVVSWIVKHWPQISREAERAAKVVEQVIRQYVVPAVQTMITYGARLVAFTRQHWDQIQSVVSRVVAWFRTNVEPTIRAVLQMVINTWNRYGKQISAAVSGVFHSAVKIIEGVMGLIRDVLHGRWSAAWEDVKKIFRGVVGWIKAVLTNLVPIVLDLAKRLGSVLWDGIKAGARALRDKVSGLARGAWSWLKNEGPDAVKGWARSAGSAVWSGIKAGAKGLAGLVRVMARAGWDYVSNSNGLAADVKRWGLDAGHALLNGILDGVSGLGAAVAHKIAQEMKDHLGDVIGWASGWTPTKKLFDWVTENAATGAYVAGRYADGDRVPVMVAGEERILNPRQVALVDRGGYTVDGALRATGAPTIGRGRGSSSPRPYGGILPGYATGAAAMIGAANRIDKKRYWYAWGGGHGQLGVPSRGTAHADGSGGVHLGFDCSGAVSAVLGAAGLISSPLDAAGLKGFGSSGYRADGVNILARSTGPGNGHAYMIIGGHAWGTSPSNPGGGPGWFSGGIRSGFTVSHVPGVTVSSVTGSGGGGRGSKPATKAQQRALASVAAQARAAATLLAGWRYRSMSFTATSRWLAYVSRILARGNGLAKLSGQPPKTLKSWRSAAKSLDAVRKRLAASRAKMLAGAPGWQAFQARIKSDEFRIAQATYHGDEAAVTRLTKLEESHYRGRIRYLERALKTERAPQIRSLIRAELQDDYGWFNGRDDGGGGGGGSGNDWQRDRVYQAGVEEGLGRLAGYLFGGTGDLGGAGGFAIAAGSRGPGGGGRSGKGDGRGGDGGPAGGGASMFVDRLVIAPNAGNYRTLGTGANTGFDLQRSRYYRPRQRVGF